MNSLPIMEDYDDASQANALIEDYIDLLTANLIGRISNQERARQKDEALFHLERLCSHFTDLGHTPKVAAEMAISRYGNPSKIADQIVQSLYERGVASRLFQYVGRANTTAFVIVGAAQLIYISLLQLRVFAPNGSAYALPLDPGNLRLLLPWPLPLPQHPLDFLILYVYPLLAPLLVGWLAGKWIPIRPGRAVSAAMLVAVIYSFVVGVSLLPQTGGLMLALFQLLFWLPVGAFVAEISLSVRLRRSLRKAPQGLRDA